MTPVPVPNPGLPPDEPSIWDIPQPVRPPRYDRGAVRGQRAVRDWQVHEHCRGTIAERTQDGSELIEFMCGVMRGSRLRWPQVHPKELAAGTVPLRPSVQQRIVAAQWLADRLWGTPARVETQPPEQLLGAELDQSVNLTEEETTRLREAYLGLREPTHPNPLSEPGS